MSSEGQRGDKAPGAFVERTLFRNPRLYQIKRFLIEDVIWGFVLSRVFRLDAHPLPDLGEKYAGRQVLVGACGPGDDITGPPIVGAASVVAFDLSPGFAQVCARRRPEWSVFCGDLLAIPHPDDAFEMSVLYSSLHHVPADAELVLAEIARVTRGRIILLEGLVPERGVARSLLLLWYRLVDGGHHYYTEGELLERVERLGLNIVSSERYSPIRHMWLAELAPREGGTLET